MPHTFRPSIRQQFEQLRAVRGEFPMAVPLRDQSADFEHMTLVL